MRMCWEVLDDIRLTRNGNLRHITRGVIIVKEKCEICGESYIGKKKDKYCSRECSAKGVAKSLIGSKRSEETKKKQSEKAKLRTGSKNPNYGNGDKIKGNKNPNWKGGYHTRGIPFYDTYAPQLEWCEEVRRNREDPNILEVRCSSCKKWYKPSFSSVNGRVQYLRDNNKVENRFYCSQECKDNCPIFNKQMWPGTSKSELTSREMQPELRKMVLERDEYQCIKCGATENLICHHIMPVAIEPLLSADIDNCIILCKECHNKIHREIDGCGYNDLKGCKYEN